MKIRRGMALGAVLAVTAGGSMAFAATETSSDVITACSDNKSVRIVASATDCKKNEQVVTWNRQGPVGPAGPAGAPGAPGLNGIDGRDGIDGTNGRDGEDGAPGRDGVDGKDGRDGVDGTNGTGHGSADRGPAGNPLSLDFGPRDFTDSSIETFPGETLMHVSAMVNVQSAQLAGAVNCILEMDPDPNITFKTVGATVSLRPFEQKAVPLLGFASVAAPGIYRANIHCSTPDSGMSIEGSMIHLLATGGRPLG